MEQFISDLSHHFTVPFTNPVLIFAVLLFIVLISPLLLKRLNVPGIIGLIVAGVIIGPHGLNLIADNAGVNIFSSIGLLYIMFIVGLELDLNEFKANRNKSVVFGFFTFFIPLIIGYPVCRYLLGYDVYASFLTASMFSTHTLVTYPIVSRMGVSKNQAVAITVGGTILTDTAVLIILAVVLNSSMGMFNIQFLLRLFISILIFSFIVFFVIPKIAQWFFQKVESEKYSHYIFVVFIVFLSGFLAELGGIEPIIGAFAAGLALNRLIPHSSALMNRIEFIGNALFIPIFLISVGMLVNISVVFSGTTTIYVAAVLSVVALLGKWLGAFFTQKVFKYSVSQRNIIFGLSSAHAAATLAVILVGFKAGIIDEYILNGTIILILFTCLVASFITQKAAKEIAIAEEDEEIIPSELGHYAQEKILVPIADPANIGKHIELAMLLKDKKSVNSISLLGVVPNNEQAEKNIISFKKKLQEQVSDAVAADMEVDVIATIDHNVASGIVRTARETMADIVIMGWPGKVGLLEKLVGDKVDLIIKNVDKNLFICHLEKKMISHKRIVVVSPPLAEKELGFNVWVNKIVQLSKELTLPVIHIGHPETQKLIASQKKLKANFTFKAFEDWSDPMACGDEIKEDDIFILISAHQGYVSHISVLDNMPTRMERRFPEVSRIVIFPKRYTIDMLVESDDYIFIP
ncbi:MAG: cation:proton antiporter [Dysgonamonadaceae bacterium]|jgi:Kef-type K+ transport system membrane component KefB|nr:cation:proton antiporter [Dysgonamonadaceae bacterium]MDD3728101.1 cation:proton antiporter [Dysgonamonadaceae bacterium]MDD4247099.1 cation:proton antiporter [Dysgonamonadaceae bacterium]MDD4606035.1 cation:proton antiporter [Dysgonamonadaceae bacterium]